MISLCNENKMKNILTEAYTVLNICVGVCASQWVLFFSYAQWNAHIYKWRYGVLITPYKAISIDFGFIDNTYWHDEIDYKKSNVEFRFLPKENKIYDDSISITSMTIYEYISLYLYMTEYLLENLCRNSNYLSSNVRSANIRNRN